MKQKLYQPAKITISALAAVTLVIGSLAMPNYRGVQAESAEELRTEAAKLQAKIDANNKKAEALSKQADSLKKKIAAYDLQIAQVAVQIELTNTKIAQLQVVLDRTQAELDRQKELLRVSLRALYKKGDASSFELLIGSQSFSQFINEQDYLTRLKEGIQISAEKVIVLKQQIQDKKSEQEDLLAQQEEQKTALSTARQDRRDLLEDTRGQESVYRRMAESLKKRQMEINSRLFAQANMQLFPGDSSKGGYPDYLANEPYGSFLVDPWGMFNRECVSYAAWRVHNDFEKGKNSRDMPSNWPTYFYRYGEGHGGNARDWLGNADKDGITYNQTPKVGSIGILAAGDFGHAVYVEKILSGNRIYVSQYNHDWNGNYSEAIITLTSPDWWFIHF